MPKLELIIDGFLHVCHRDKDIINIVMTNGRIHTGKILEYDESSVFLDLKPTREIVGYNDEGLHIEENSGKIVLNRQYISSIRRYEDDT